METAVKERWVKQLMEDYPMIDRMMAESAVEMYLEDPEYVNRLAEGKEEVPPPEERNVTYTYGGVSVEDAPSSPSSSVTVEDDAENNITIEQ